MRNGIYSANKRHVTATIPTVPSGNIELKSKIKPPSAMPEPPGVGEKYNNIFNIIMRPITKAKLKSSVKLDIKIGTIP